MAVYGRDRFSQVYKINTLTDHHCSFKTNGQLRFFIFLQFFRLTGYIAGIFVYSNNQTFLALNNPFNIVYGYLHQQSFYKIAVGV
jgi:hypothetical protein